MTANWAELAVGDHHHDQGDEEQGPVASSTSDAPSGTREQHAGVPLRRVRADELREDFLYDSRPALRPGSDPTVTGVPA
jgi:hypothetical protein